MPVFTGQKQVSFFKTITIETQSQCLKKHQKCLISEFSSQKDFWREIQILFENKHLQYCKMRLFWQFSYTVTMFIFRGLLFSLVLNLCLLS